MTTALATPPARRTSSCDVAINNINMILAVLHIPKKEVAEALGKMPQSFSRMLKNGYQWTFDDMLEVSDILQVGLDDLTNPDLTPNRVIEARAKNGGYNVAVDGDGRIRWGMAGLLGVLGWSHNPVSRCSEGGRSVQGHSNDAAVPTVADGTRSSRRAR